MENEQGGGGKGGHQGGMPSKIATDLGDVSDMAPGMDRDMMVRSAALVMAIRYHVEAIVKDGDLYREMTRATNGPALVPTSEETVVRIARRFESYLRGEDREASVRMGGPDGEEARDILARTLAGGGEGDRE